MTGAVGDGKGLVGGRGLNYVVVLSCFFLLLLKTLYVKERSMRIIEIIIHIYVFWVFFRKSANYTPCIRSILKMLLLLLL